MRETSIKRAATNIKTKIQNNEKRYFKYFFSLCTLQFTGNLLKKTGFLKTPKASGARL